MVKTLHKSQKLLTHHTIASSFLSELKLVFREPYTTAQINWKQLTWTACCWGNRLFLTLTGELTSHVHSGTAPSCRPSSSKWHAYIGHTSSILMVHCTDLTEGILCRFQCSTHHYLCLPCLPLAVALVPPAFFWVTTLAVDGGPSFFRPPNLTWKAKWRI